MIDFDAIRRNNPLPAIVGGVVKVQQAGHEWQACCPFHQDRSPSFTIWNGGQRFFCFGCGATGDVLDFVQRLHQIGIRDAAAMLSAGDIPALEGCPPPSAKVDRTEEAREIWRAAKEIQLSLAENYLRTRGLHLPIPPTLRFARLPYGKKGPRHPCLVAAVSGPDNRLTGVQRTYLNTTGTGKAAVPKAKLSLGRVIGGAVRLAPAAAELVVCEGLEDGLTLQQQIGRPVWVAAGASMLPAMQFPPLVRSVIIGGDNDETGRTAAAKAERAFLDRGLSVRTIYPTSGKDFNAELIGRVQ